MPLTLATQSGSKRAAVHTAGAAMVVLVVAVFYKGVYAPLRDEIADSAIRIEKVRALTAGGERISQTHSEMLERLDLLTEAATKTRERMPKEISAGDFVEHATRLAAEFGLTVEQFQTALPQTYPGHATIDVSCRLVGSYASTCQFLAAIDQLAQLSNVSRLELTRTPDPRRYPVQVTFQLYYQLDPHDKDQQRGTL